ncbi:MAG: glycerophosphodiester phosphodiesterase family protein [Planctomycetota bacterium]
MDKTPERIGLHGEGVPGPPWILGHRGAPRYAPENTLVSLRRALELGLDGFEYDLHACASGEAVLLHDDTLDRTTDHTGLVSELTLPELAGVDAGAWFRKGFRGEPLPLLEEALDLPPDDPTRGPPLHMIEVKEPDLVTTVARRVEELGDGLGVRLASFDRRACLVARDLGLQAMLLAVSPSEDDRRFVRDERLAAYSVGPGGWAAWERTGGSVEWPCERWGWSLDDPDELLWAARAPLFGWNTNEPERALAARALAWLAPDDGGRWPVRLPGLEVEPDPRGDGVHGAWSGRWTPTAAIRNPFPFAVEAACDLLVRGGAFEVEGLPTRLALAPGEEAALGFAVSGGSWSPGDDPRLLVRYAWGAGPGRRAGALVLDATLERRRTVRLAADARRLAMLCEGPGDPQASLVLRRRRGELLVRVENPGGLDEVRTLVRLGGEVRRGGHGARIPLPEGFDEAREGVPFSCGFEGRDRAGGRRLRRWAGGLPAELGSGAPGRLYPATTG